MTAHALCRDSRPPRVQEQGGSTLAGADQVGPRPGEIRRDRLQRRSTDRHDALLRTLAAQQHRLGVGVDVVHVEPDRLRDAGAGAVEHLQERPVTQRERRARRAAGRQHRLDVLEGDRLRQPLGRRRRAYGGRRVVLGQPVLHAELVEPTNGHDGAACAGRTQRRMVGVAFPQRDQEGGDHGLVDRAEVIDPPTAQELQVAAQVTTVGLQGVVGQTSLDGEVVEVAPERPARSRPRSPVLEALPSASSRRRPGPRRRREPTGSARRARRPAARTSGPTPAPARPPRAPSRSCPGRPCSDRGPGRCDAPPPRPPAWPPC